MRLHIVARMHLINNRLRFLPVLVLVRIARALSENAFISDDDLAHAAAVRVADDRLICGLQGMTTYFHIMTVCSQCRRHRAATGP